MKAQNRRCLNESMSAVSGWRNGSKRVIAFLLLLVAAAPPLSAQIRAAFVVPPWPGGWTNMRNDELQKAVIEIEGVAAGQHLSIVAATGITPESTAEDIAGRLELAPSLSGSEIELTGEKIVELGNIFPPGIPTFYQLWIEVDGHAVLPLGADELRPRDVWTLWGQTGYEGPGLDLNAALLPGYDDAGAASLSGNIGLEITNPPFYAWEWRTGYRWALVQGTQRLALYDFPDGLTFLQYDSDGESYGNENIIEEELPEQWDWPSGGDALLLQVGRWDTSTGDFVEPVEDPETPEGGEFSGGENEIQLHGECMELGTPSNVVAFPGTEISVSWDPVDGAAGYLVRYGNDESGFIVTATNGSSLSFPAGPGQTYRIKVRAFSSCGNWRVFGPKSTRILVGAASVDVVLDADRTALAPGETLNFSNRSMLLEVSEEDVIFTLDFGDGSPVEHPAIGESLAHQYDRPGLFTARLSAAWPSGGADADALEIGVATPLEVAISARPGEVTSGTRIYRFTANVPSDVVPQPDTYSWTYDGLPAGNERSFSREIPISGNFDVGLVISRAAPIDDSEKAEMHGLAAEEIQKTVLEEMSGGGKAAFSYFIAATAHVHGEEDAFFYGDLAILNPPENPDAHLRLYFLEQGANNSDVSGEAFVLPPGHSTFVQDIVQSFFGIDAGVGAVLAASDHPLIISSRIYDGGGRGSFGQYLGAEPSISGLHNTQQARLIQLSQSGNFRTNVGFVNVSTEALRAGRLLLEGHDGEGGLLGLKAARRVPPASLVQIPSILEPGEPVDVADAILQVRYDATGNELMSRPLLLYASVVDNRSNDPTTITPVLELSPGIPGYIAVVAKLAGLADTQWRSDVEVHNSGQEQAEYTLSFFPAGNPPPPSLVSGPQILPPGRSLRYSDVLGSVFGLEAGVKGSLRIDVQQGRVMATSRTYNVTDEGSFGQFIPGIPTYAAARRGDVIYTAQIINTQEYRCNLGLANLTDSGFNLKITLYNRDGGTIGSVVRRLPYNGFAQWSISSLFGAATRLIGWLKVEIHEGDGEDEGIPAVLGYLSVVDNLTGDPTYIPLTSLRPVASFGWTPETPATGEEIQLRDESLGYPSSWKWTAVDSEGREVFSSDERDSLFIPDSAGDYQLTLSLDAESSLPSTMTKTLSVSSGKAGR